MSVLLLGGACGGSKDPNAAGDGTVPAPTPAEPTTAVGPAAFAGSWFRHGIGLDVSSTGAVDASYRTYRWCTEGPPPCDKIDDNGLITDGGHLVGDVAGPYPGVCQGRRQARRRPSRS
ncbi:MAG: hypothetical protein ACR2MO_03765 [Acidimicrobiales bacterium]